LAFTLQAITQNVWDNTNTEVHPFLYRMAQKGFIEYNDLIKTINRVHILNALNMKELIAHSKIEYHDIATDICQDSSKIKSIKDKLSNNKETSTLFDTKLYVKNLELAYLEIYKKNKKNLKPENIYIIN
jgi:hypothetical protein